MSSTALRIALASPPHAGSIDGALDWVARYIAEAASQGARIVCFPESYVPGYRGAGFVVAPHDPQALSAARDTVCALAKEHAIHVILTMDWDGPDGILNAAFVISADGAVTGVQHKNLLAPSEDGTFAPGDERQLFEVDGVPFGVAICIEGWRYPETVRWATTRGAQVVFHPTLTGCDDRNALEGPVQTEWCHPDGPYYEKALTCRALENGVFMASVNYALKYPQAATAVVDPEGTCVERLPYGTNGLLVTDIDPRSAHLTYAKRLV